MQGGSSSSLAKTKVKVPLAFTLSFSLPLVLVISAALALVSYSQVLPAVVKDTPESHSIFSEERARKHAARLVEFGVRMVGQPANEDFTPKYIMSTLEAYKKMSDPSRVRFEIETQVASGSFFMDFVGGVTLVYSNVTNILVRLSDARRPVPEHSLLVGSHYDSAVGSTGGMDAAAPIAVMLETVRTLATGAKAVDFTYGVVLNFNGGEEAIMTGAHAFSEHHPWAKTIRAQVNMDSSGAGGKEIVFQAGPKHAWLMGVYAKVAPHPHGSVLAQDIFSTEVIPSDTDFRVYRDELGIPGYDLAYFRNGYVYHTLRDDMVTMDVGSLQHTGDNVVALVKALTVGHDAALLHGFNAKSGDKTVESSAVFFDFVGFFMITTDQVTLNLLSLITIITFFSLLSYLVFPRKVHRNLLISSLKTVFFSWSLSVIFPMVCGLILNQVRPMGWYSHPWLSISLFGSLSLSGGLLALSWYGRGERETEASHLQLSLSLLRGSAGVWGAILVLSRLAGVGSQYIPLCVVVSLSLSLSLSETAPFRLHLIAMNSVRWGVLVVIATFVPFTLLVNMLNDLVNLFVPLTGRLGGAPVDAIVGGLIGFIMGACLSLSLSFVHRAGNLSLLRKGVALVAVVSLIASMGFVDRYRVYNPKRLFLEHVVDRTANPVRSGIVAASFDRVPTSVVSPVYRRPKADWSDKLYLNYIFPFNLMLNDFVFLPDVLPPMVPGSMQGEWEKLGDMHRLTLEVSSLGGCYSVIKIFCEPTKGSQHCVEGWSFTKKVPKPQMRDNTPFIHFRRSANAPGKWSFHVDLPERVPVTLELTVTEQGKTHSLSLLEKEIERESPFVSPSLFYADMSSYTF